MKNKNNKKSTNRFYSKKDMKRKTKKPKQIKDYQSSIFDFIGPDENLDSHINVPMPTRVDVVSAKSFLTERSFNALLNDTSYLNSVVLNLEKLEIPIYEFTSEKGRKYAKVVNSDLYSDERPVFISTDLFVKVISKGKILNFIPFDGKDDIMLTDIDGKIDCYSTITLAMEAFLGFYPVISPFICLKGVPNWDNFDNIENLDFSESFLLSHPVKFVDSLLKLSKHVEVKPTVLKPKEKQQPKVEKPVKQKEEKEVVTPSYDKNHSILLPINIYGIKDGYFYDPKNRKVTTLENSNLIVDNHHLKSRGIVYLELSEPSYDNEVYLGPVSINEIHEIYYLEKTFLPSLHYIEDGKIETRESYVTPPLELTEDMKQFIKENLYVSLDNNRVLAEKVYGTRHITPIHTKEVASYRTYLLMKNK